MRKGDSKPKLGGKCHPLVSKCGNPTNGWFACGSFEGSQSRVPSKKDTHHMKGRKTDTLICVPVFLFCFPLVQASSFFPPKAESVPKKLMDSCFVCRLCVCVCCFREPSTLNIQVDASSCASVGCTCGEVQLSVQGGLSKASPRTMKGLGVGVRDSKLMAPTFPLGR